MAKGSGLSSLNLSILLPKLKLVVPFLVPVLRKEVLSHTL